MPGREAHPGRDSSADVAAAVVGPRVYLETFGCQMNELDSELVRGQLSGLGYTFTNDPGDAEVLVYNTCSVREQAENKAYSRIGLAGVRKREGERLVLAVIGCMAERDGIDMIRRHPQIDVLCGPGELDRLPRLLDNALRQSTLDVMDRVALQGRTNRRLSTLAAAEDNLELLDRARAFDPGEGDAGGRAAYVRITRGCNKFCTYCVVPNTRGAEVHRPPDAIVDECRMLADKGVVEVTLLGQTVNHYLYVHGAALGADGREVPQVGPGAAAFRPGASRALGRVTTFADLLHRIHEEVPGIRRLRFVTSYPRDFGDDILEVMRACPRICRYLHVPAQSGSDRILKLMNRGYTVGEYLEFIDRARAILPDVSISGDIIVGFPTESEEDFAATEALVRRVQFKNNFIFKYSPRPGTVAMDRLPDDVPEHVKRRRNNHLLDVQAEVSAAVHREQVGRVVEVFVERRGQRPGADRPVDVVGRPDHGPSGADGGYVGAELTIGGRPARRLAETPGEAGDAREHSMSEPVSAASDSGLQLTGRTPGDHIVAFDLPASETASAWIGRIVQVEITDARSLLLYGRLVDDRVRDRPGAGSLGTSEVDGVEVNVRKS